jgi:hypothetical protein
MSVEFFRYWIIGFAGEGFTSQYSTFRANQNPDRLQLFTQTNSDVGFGGLGL